MNSSKTDEQIIEECRSQSKDWDRYFSILVTRHQEALFQYLWKRTRSIHNAEDLTQESFLRAYQKINLFDSNYKFKTWLFTIATRLCLNQVKKKTPDSNAEDILEQEVQKESAETDFGLWEKAKLLNEDQYTVLILKYSEDYSIQDISKIMDKSENNIKVLLYRARQALTKHLPQKQELNEKVTT